MSKKNKNTDLPPPIPLAALKSAKMEKKDRVGEEEIAFASDDQGHKKANGDETRQFRINQKRVDQILELTENGLLDLDMSFADEGFM